jgi:DNA end-binding protein Ku
MPRAIWSGAISFGLVNIPVKLYSAVQRKTVRFHQLDQEDNQRIQQKRMNPRTGEEVPYENLVKGYEVGPDLDQIDPIFYDHPYYLVPDTGADKAYRLLLDAMGESGKVAIGRVVLRTKEYLVAIRPRDSVLTMETMLFADEVIPPDQLDEQPSDGKAKTNQKELQMAQQLIDSLAEDFEPESYRDEYRERVLEMIERKAEGQEIVVEAPPEEPKEVPDLMAALEASIASAKGQGGGKRAKPKKRERAASSDGKPSSRKKTAKKS